MKEEKIWAAKDGYLVNRDGSIYKLNWNNTGKMRRVKQSQRDDGYLYFGCNGRTTFAHRFIAECFIPNPDNLPCINHKDENKTNNRVENLEWCDYKYNLNYGTHNKRVGESNSKALKNNPKICKKVYQYTKDGVLVKEWCSLREIERVFGYCNGYISRCCNGKYKYAYDYIWSFKPLADLSESNNSPRVK